MVGHLIVLLIFHWTNTIDAYTPPKMFLPIDPNMHVQRMISTIWITIIDVSTFTHSEFIRIHPKEEPKTISQALKDESWVEAMQEELLQFKLQKVWILVDLPSGKKAIGTKWVKQQPDGIFISQDKFMIGSLVYLTALSPDIMFAVCACVRTSMNLRIDRSCAGSLSHIWSMANLRYSDKHNMVAFLKKPTESVGFTEIVDFLKGTSLRVLQGYMLPLMTALIAVQHQIKGPTVTPVADKATTTGVGVETEGATTITTGLDAGLDSGNIHESPLRSHEAPLPEGNTSGSAKDSLNLKELMDIVPMLVLRIDNLEKELQQTKSTYGKVVLTLVERVKLLLEAALKRKSMKVILSELEDEETED
ncbi:hypothetical protein Tco_1531979 [Tanacetum coccineum]